MTGRWSKSYLHRRWPKTGRLAREQPAGRDHNKSHEVIYIYIYTHPLCAVIGRVRSYEASSKRNKRFGSVTTVCRDIKAGSRPPATKDLSDTRVNDDKSPAWLETTLHPTWTGHRRHSRSQPPWLASSSSSSNVASNVVENSGNADLISRFFVGSRFRLFRERS